MLPQSPPGVFKSDNTAGKEMHFQRLKCRQLCQERPWVVGGGGATSLVLVLPGSAEGTDFPKSLMPAWVY